VNRVGGAALRRADLAVLVDALIGALSDMSDDVGGWGCGSGSGWVVVAVAVAGWQW
jgi:hypothetical protein